MAAVTIEPVSSLTSSTLRVDALSHKARSVVTPPSARDNSASPFLLRRRVPNNGAVRDAITVFLADDNLIAREGVRALLALEEVGDAEMLEHRLRARPRR